MENNLLPSIDEVIAPTPAAEIHDSIQNDRQAVAAAELAADPIAAVNVVLDAPIASVNLTPIERARVAYAAFCRSDTDAVRNAMDLGDALPEVLKGAPKRGQHRYLKDVIGVSKTVANDSMQLAKARPVIEAHLAHLAGTAGHLSFRGALGLIRKSDPTKEVPVKKDEIAELVSKFNKATSKAQQACIAKWNADRLRQELLTQKQLEELRADYAQQHARIPETDVKIAQPIIQALQDALYLAIKDDSESEITKKLTSVNHQLTMAERDLWRLLDVPAPHPPKMKGRKAA